MAESPRTVTPTPSSPLPSLWLRRNPLDVIDQDHERQSGLCDLLEAIADQLPDVDRKSCKAAIPSLRHELVMHHKDEEKGLFPILRRHAEGNLGPVLARLEGEHTADESFALELIEALEAAAETGTASNPEALGYMLRGFFEIHRRHIHWETDVLMPLARRTLSRAELDELAEIMASHRQV